MLRITIYKVLPFSLIQGKQLNLPEYPTEWLRLRMNDLVNQNGGRLKAAGVDTSLFHNHKKANTEHTNPRYPLIIYHCINHSFLCLGINQGAEALKELIYPLKEFTQVGDIYLKFEVVQEEYKLDVRNTDTPLTYQLTDWLPFSTDAHKEFTAVPGPIAKTKMLKDKLLSHLSKHFAKFLELKLENTTVSILDVDSFNRKNILLKAHKQLYSYQPVSVVFSVNINLPEWITLGNKTAFGFGRVNRK